MKELNPLKKIKTEEFGNIYASNFPIPTVTLDVVLFGIEENILKILLIKRNEEPFKNMYALPGHLECLVDDDLEDGAIRELKEETDIDYTYFEQLCTFGKKGRDPRGRYVTVAYLGLTNKTELGQMPDGIEVTEVKWFDINSLPDLAYDHKEIIDVGLKRLKNKIDWEPIGFNLLPDKFALSELQKVYEIIKQEKIDKRNFRRWISSKELIEPTGMKRRGVSGPETELYTFKEQK